MDDPVRVGVGEPGQHVLQHAADLRQVQPPDPRPQRAARDVLHRDVRRPLVLEEVEHGDDARVVQRAREPRLAHEARGHLGVLALQRAELLQRREAIQVQLAGEVDARHAAPAELSDDLVAADEHVSILASQR